MTSNVEKPAVEQLDKTGEYFTVGGPLHAVRSGYIRRAADDQLTAAVLAHRYAYVAAPNRSGKSSLIAGTAAHLENNGVRIAVLDLDQISSRDSETDPGRWYYNIAYRLLRQLRIRFELQEWWQDKSVLSNRQRLLEFYAEILLANISEDIVVFVDGLQSAEELPFADQLLASIRSAFNARSLDPDFMRLTFVMSGEFDPQSLVVEAEASPFNIARRIRLDDFSREQVQPYASELDEPADIAEQILDRIFYWTEGQPYLTQKLARAVARVEHINDPVDFVDQLVRQQFAGRAAVQNEPHMSHIQRRMLGDRKQREALLTLYGRVRKGVTVITDLGDTQQRRLIAIGLLVVDKVGNLQLRNRIYATVFTARWANENLATQWRAPAIAAAIILLMLCIPFWYTQLLPKAYVDVLTQSDTSIADARTTWQAYRSFPMHTTAADNLYTAWLTGRASVATEVAEITELSERAAELGTDPNLPATLMANYWSREAAIARRLEDRDDALLATIESLRVSTLERRNRAATLIADDYPLLIASLTQSPDSRLYFDATSRMITTLDGAEINQWRVADRAIIAVEPWAMSALDITPVVRRVVLDAPGTVRQIALRLRISHQRLDDLSIRLIAPSGKSVPIVLSQDQAVGSQELTIPRQQLRELIGEDRTGTWSLSIRDQGIGVAGYLVAWSLSLNSQALIEEFERGINIPNPEETPGSGIWVDPSGRFGVARSASGDSLRVWDLNFSRPVSNLPINAGEALIGFDRSGSVLVTATSDALHLWDVIRGEFLRRLDSELATTVFRILPEADSVLAKRVSEGGATYQLLRLSDISTESALDVAGQVLLDDVSADGRRLAIVDYDRSLRIWDMQTQELLAQIDLRHRPTKVELTRSGAHVAVVYANNGVAQWRVDRPEQPVFEDSTTGEWMQTFSPSGRLSVTGQVGRGYQIRRNDDGGIVGPLLGQHDGRGRRLLAFSKDEQMLLTTSADGALRLWRVPEMLERPVAEEHSGWSVAFDTPLVLSGDGAMLVSADNSGHVHAKPVSAIGEPVSAQSEDVNYLGHASAVSWLAVNDEATAAVSVSDDNDLKLWSLINGQPSEWTAKLPTAEVVDVRFSPGGRLVAILFSDHMRLIDRSNGDERALIQFPETQSAFSFVSETRLFVGSISGALRVVNIAQTPTQQVVWQGSEALIHLEVSPLGEQLIIADADNGLVQFDLATNEIGDARVQLPGAIREVLFGPSMSRVFVRTNRWMHSFSASSKALIWKDAVLLPGLPASVNTVALSSTEFAFPIPNGSDIQVMRFGFADASGAGLFGNREDLLRDWSARLGRGQAETPAVSPSDSPTVSDGLREEF